MNLGKQNKVTKQTIKESFLIRVCFFELSACEEIVCPGFAEVFWEAAPQITDLESKNFWRKNLSEH